jgi:hypothetical protein
MNLVYDDESPTDVHEPGDVPSVRIVGEPPSA